MKRKFKAWTYKASKAWIYKVSREPPTFVIKTGLARNNPIRYITHNLQEAKEKAKELADTYEFMDICELRRR